MYSQTAEYALRAITCLAARADGLVPTGTLARQTGVPQKYLAKVLQHLAGAGLIAGRRGVGGGYRLLRPAHQLSMLEVIKTFEPMRRIPSAGAPHPGLAALRRRTETAMAAAMSVLSSSTIADLVEDAALHGLNGDGASNAHADGLGALSGDPSRPGDCLV